MLTSIDVTKWPSCKVRDWLLGVCDDSNWLKQDLIIKNKIGGDKLLSMTAQDIELLGADKVNLQEHVLEAIENLRYYNFDIDKETLQSRIFQLSCLARSLQKQLVFERKLCDDDQTKNVILSADFEMNNQNKNKKQRVSLDTLTSISNMVKLVKHITGILNSIPFSKCHDYKTMKSLLLVLSIELTSTAQRDQFVECPNDIIEKSSKALADYCDRIVAGTRDPLLIQASQVETVRMKKNQEGLDWMGLKLKPSQMDSIYVIDNISPLSAAKKTNKLSVGDEILQFNQYIVGWSPRNVERLLTSTKLKENVTLVVKKNPSL